MKTVLVFLAAALAAPALIAQIPYPQWWVDYGVAETPYSNYGPDGLIIPIEDKAVALQGQAKHIAEQARSYLETELAGIGGFGPLPAEYTHWVGNRDNDNQPLLVGQLKWLAVLFYDRLIALNIVTDYPWIAGQYDERRDKRPAVLGQIKYVFSFDLSGWSPDGDGDGDGLPDWWELQFGLDATDDGTTDPLNGATGDVEPTPDGLDNLTEYLIGSNPMNDFVSPSTANALQVYKP